MIQEKQDYVELKQCLLQFSKQTFVLTWAV
jgi:hypothetical protein